MERRGYGEEYINRYKMMTRSVLSDKIENESLYMYCFVRCLWDLYGRSLWINIKLYNAENETNYYTSSLTKEKN